MRFLIAAFFILFLPMTGHAFSATVVTKQTVPMGQKHILWDISSTDKGLCLSLGEGNCASLTKKNADGFVVVVGSGEKEVRGRLLFDENAELPWNLLLPGPKNSVSPLAVEIRVGGTVLRRAYMVKQFPLEQSRLQELIAQDVPLNPEGSYICMQVLQGENVLCEQVWAEGEKFWLLELTPNSRSVRSGYVH